MLLTCAHLRNSKNLMCGYKSNILPLVAPPPNTLSPDSLGKYWILCGIYSSPLVPPFNKTRQPYHRLQLFSHPPSLWGLFPVACGKMPQRRLHFGQILIQRYSPCDSQLWPYAWSLSSIAFDVKGRKKESLLPMAKNNFRGLEAKQRWCQLSPRTVDKTAVSGKPISCIFFSIFLLPLLTPFSWHTGETSYNIRGKLWVSCHLIFSLGL